MEDTHFEIAEGVGAKSQTERMQHLLGLGSGKFQRQVGLYSTLAFAASGFIVY
jgi:hypothetical protein